MLCSCFSAKMFELPTFCCIQCNDSEVSFVQPFFGQVPFKDPNGRFHAVRSEPDACAHSTQGHEVCNLHWDSCIHRRCLLQLLLSWRKFLEESPWHIRINCFFASDAQDDSDVEVQGPDFLFWFALQEPVSTHRQVKSALPVNAGAPMHSSAQVGRFMALCFGYSKAFFADLMVVLVESVPLQSQPIKNRHRNESFQSAHLGP